MSEFTIRVTETDGVVGIALTSPDDSAPIARIVAKALSGVLPVIVSRAVKIASGKCECPDCQQEQAAEPAPPAQVLH